MNRLGWELFVAARQLRSGHSLGFISVITWFSVLGITIGTAALIIVISVMSGFETEVRERIIGLDAHLRVRSFLPAGIANPDSIRTVLDAIPEIVASSPYILEKGMLSHKGVTEGAVVRGVDPEGYGRVTDLAQHVVDGVLDLETRPGSLPPIVMGRYLAANLNDGYIASRDMKLYAEALRAVVSGEKTPAEAIKSMPRLKRVGGTCPCSKGVRWVMEDSDGGQTTVAVRG